MHEAIRDALIIFNPRAGRAKKLLYGGMDRVREILEARGIETTLQRTDTPEAAEEAAHCAIQQTKHLVIACGGDGTLNAVVNGLAGSTVPMTLLPAGTANILAKELSFPKDIEGAAECIASGTLRRIALGKVTTCENGGQSRYFLSVGGAGPDGTIVQAIHVNNTVKRRAGMLAFWVEGFRQFASYSFPRFRISLENRELEATLVVVGRTKHYGGPLRITTEADLFGNDFEIMTCATRSRFRYMSYVPLACLGRVRSARETTFLRTCAFRCEPIDQPPALVQVDGEPAGRLPAEFRVIPDSLTLLVPNQEAIKVTRD